MGFSTHRSSCVFFQIGVLKKFEVSKSKSITLLKGRLPPRCFSVNYGNIFIVIQFRATASPHIQITVKIFNVEKSQLNLGSSFLINF